MNPVITGFTLDFDNTLAPVSVPVTLYDTNREWRIYLTNDGQRWVIEEGTYATLAIKRPDDKGTYHGAFDISDQYLSYSFAKNRGTAAFPGVHECTITIYDKNNLVVSAPQFTMVVTERAVTNDDLDFSGDQLAQLDAIMVAETERVTAEGIRISQETVRAGQEKSRIFAENKRIAAETARANAETARANAETARAEAETARANAETARVTSENAIAEAETARVAAETERDKKEAERIAAETARATAEEARVEAETARADAEEPRKTNEASRIQAENARAEAETARANAETARVGAENQRVVEENRRNTYENERERFEWLRESHEQERQATYEEILAKKNNGDFDGKSAYAYAVEGGFAGTESDFTQIMGSAVSCNHNVEEMKNEFAKEIEDTKEQIAADIEEATNIAAGDNVSFSTRSADNALLINAGKVCVKRLVDEITYWYPFWIRIAADNAKNKIIPIEVCTEIVPSYSDTGEYYTDKRDFFEVEFVSDKTVIAGVVAAFYKKGIVRSSVPAQAYFDESENAFYISATPQYHVIHEHKAFSIYTLPQFSNYIQIAENLSETATELTVEPILTADYVDKKIEDSVSERVTPLEERVAPLEEKVTALDERVTPLEERVTELENLTLTYTEDTTSAYIKSIPAEVGKYALVKSVGGNTRLVHNENCKNLLDPTLFGTANSLGQVYYFGNSQSMSANVTLPAGTYMITSDTIPIAIPSCNVSVNNSATFTLTQEETFVIYIAGDYASQEDPCYVSIMLNEGDTELPFEPYKRCFEDTKVEKIESVGSNLFNGELVKNIIYKDANFGEQTQNGDTYRSIKIYLDEGTYSLQSDISFIIIRSVIDGIYSQNAVTATKKYTFTVNVAGYVGLSFRNSTQGVVWDDTSKIWITYGDAEQSYKDYRGTIDTITIPEAVKALKGYGKGINDTYYNYIEFVGKNVYFHKVCEEIVLDGSEGWHLWTTTGINQFYTERNVANIPSAGVITTLNNKYKDILADNRTENYETLYSPYKKCIAINTQAHTTVDELKAHLADNPLTVIYALETPEVTDITHLFTEDNAIEVEGGGTFHFVNESGIAVPNTTQYVTRRG